jgi:hypothetical protein
LKSDSDGSDADDSDIISASESPLKREDDTNGNGDDVEDDGDFGDDFDDFEEGGEGDDFGDFDDGFQGEEQTETTFDNPPHQPSIPAPSPGPVSQNYSIPRVFALKHAHCSAVMNAD